MTSRSFLVTVFVLSTLALIRLAAAQQPLPQGQGAPNEEPSSSDTLMDRTDLGNVAQAAKMQYGSGVRELKKAEKLLRKAAETTDEKERTKAQDKAAAALESADKAFREALSYNASFVEAYSGLGTALRLQGKAEEALQVHAMALRRFPEDMENFRGWTESLMDLNLLGNATSAYSGYVQSNPARAEILLVAIEEWLAEKKTNPGEIDPADVQRLADWVSQQNRAS